MSVHIGEVHTDVASVAGLGPAAQSTAPDPSAATQERWGELRRSAEVLNWRTSAEGFDD